ncbi:hypothetical protein [Burkholderia mayonis]|uniref:Uncharacterized protein n=1 Tax=Burkholderia mayonis TaxID=1385591 RepID=A0A1B4FW60_9BURK|nr:hypothetical protein [Burkholderia mayonis]AOJ07902.1 hypothetical protein WS71_11770 [Burkholderia mayonis]KVE55406.1 hypothetical protein WS71_02865 [Burkholderia mayonis]
MHPARAAAVLRGGADARRAVRRAFAIRVARAAITAALSRRRRLGAAHTPSHVAEMIVMSIPIPPVSLSWRPRGAFHFKVMFL